MTAGFERFAQAREFSGLGRAHGVRLECFGVERGEAAAGLDHELGGVALAPAHLEKLLEITGPVFVR